jgi:hypothetical protein
MRPKFEIVFFPLLKLLLIEVLTKYQQRSVHDLANFMHFLCFKVTRFDHKYRRSLLSIHIRMNYNIKEVNIENSVAVLM